MPSEGIFVSPQTTKYDASHLQVLEGLEAIRKRPGMYIGSTDVRGLLHLALEAAAPSLDEVAAGRVRRVEVTLLSDGGLRVVDDCQDVAFESADGLGLDQQLTTLRVGRRPSQRDIVHFPSVGLCVVNALSSRLVAEVRSEGVREVREYRQGAAVSPAADRASAEPGAVAGTTITLWPDPGIFTTTQWPLDQLVERFRELSFLNRELDIMVTDERSPERRTLRFHNSGGPQDMVASLDEPTPPLVHPDTIAFERDDPRMEGTMDVAFRWRRSGPKQIHGFANSNPTPGAGTHVLGFHDGLTAALSAYARAQGLLAASDPDLDAGQVGEGLTAVVSVRLDHVVFEGCTRGTLGNPEVRHCVEEAVVEHFGKWLAEHSPEAAAILDHILQRADRGGVKPVA